MALADRLDQRPIGATQIRILVLMVMLLMVEGLDLQLLGLLTPVILKEWAVERAAFGPAMAAALLGLALGCGLGGPLGDRFGRKKVLMVCAVIFAAGTAGAGLTNNVMQMTAVRFISGMGFGAASPVSITLVAEWLPRRIQPTAIALITVGTPFGGMVGSLALIALIPVLGWRGCFMACGALTIVLAALVLLGMPESPAYLTAKGRLADALRLLRRHVDPEMSEGDLAPASSHEKRQAEREAVFGQNLRRLTLGGWLLFFAAQFIAYSIISWATTMLTLARFPMAQALQGTFAFNVSAVAATLVAGPLVQWFGSRRVIAGSSILTLASLVLLLAALGGFVGGEPRYWLVILSIAGTGTFISICMAAGYAMATLGYPERVRATGIGIALMIGRMGGVTTGLLGGKLLSLAGDESYPLLAALIALSIVTFGAGFVVDRHIAPRARHA